MNADNPPAFPVPNDANVNGQEGMTLRDYFAGQAVTMPAPNYWQHGGSEDGQMLGSSAEIIARRAYAIADAMLAARQEQSHEA